MKSSIGLGLESYDSEIGEDKAVPLIRLEKNRFVVEKEAIDLLRKIEKPVAVMCVCGKYRTGKSYLLNKVLIGNSDGFNVASTINPCTKGLWLWKRPLKCKIDDEEFAVFLIDTEGLAALDQDENHDTKVILLGLLLSSLLLYNSMGSIDENALNSLSLVINIANTLQLYNSKGMSEEEFARNFPSFLWVLRDFALQLKDPDGNPISSKKYLETALGLQKGSSEAVENKNKIRRLIKHFFSDRDCSTLVRPTESEADIQSLLSVKDDKLRPKFVSEVNALKEKIRKKLHPKIVNGKKVNGPMLADLCISYTEEINSEKIPSIHSAWAYVCKSQCETALQNLQHLHDTLFKTRIMEKLPMEKREVKKILNEAINFILKSF